MPADVEEMEHDSTKLVGPRKAAAFLLALDASDAALVLKNLSEREVTVISEEMTKLGELNAEMLDEVLKEYGEGDVNITDIEPMLEDILRQAVGPERAKALIERIRRRSRDLEPFKILRRLTAPQIEAIIKGEHPQVLAIVLNFLDTQVSYEILRNMDESLRYDVVKRIAMTENMPFEMIRQIDQMLEERAIESASQPGFASEGNRFQIIAQMMNIADASISKSIMEQLTNDMPEEAQEIQALMFVFDDLSMLGDKDIQKVLGEVDKAVLAMALKTAKPELADKILGNMSKRGREAMEEEIEMLGPKPLSEVEEAQKEIVELVRGLEEKGDITINRGGGEEFV